MNIVVIGLGSMGQRRVRLLKQYIKKAKQQSWNLLGIDFNQERREECNKNYGIDTFDSLHQAKQKYHLDAAIISTAPLSHATIIEECLRENLHVFSELNLVDVGYVQNQVLAKERNKVLFLSSTFLYRKEIQYLQEIVRKKQFTGMYRYHVGQYLPTWHPWENYRNFFVNDRRTNACREIFAIELPWLIACFGNISNVYSSHKKISNLEIDYDDSYQVVIEHASGVVGTLTVDVVTPKVGREFELWQENFCLTWNGTPDTVRAYNENTGAMENVVLYDEVEHQEGYNRFIVENAYYEELVNYIQVITEQDVPKYSFEQDAEILKIIDKIEE